MSAFNSGFEGFFGSEEEASSFIRHFEETTNTHYVIVKHRKSSKWQWHRCCCSLLHRTADGVVYKAEHSNLLRPSCWFLGHLEHWGNLRLSHSFRKAIAVLLKWIIHRRVYDNQWPCGSILGCCYRYRLNISEILAAATSNGVTSGRKVNTGYHFQLMYSSLTTGSRLMGETGAFSDP